MVRRDCRHLDAKYLTHKHSGGGPFASLESVTTNQEVAAVEVRGPRGTAPNRRQGTVPRQAFPGMLALADLALQLQPPTLEDLQNAHGPRNYRVVTLGHQRSGRRKRADTKVKI